MPSQALIDWWGTRARDLDEIETALGALRGAGPGHRRAFDQVVQAYTLLISAHFQGFCRDLHTASVTRLLTSIVAPTLLPILSDELLSRRALDRGNPTPGNIGADFARLGSRFWDDAQTLDARTVARRILLEQLNEWRNAIAHQDFVRVVGGTRLRLGTVRTYRRACMGLSQTFDQVVRSHIITITGVSPWA